MKWYKDFLSKPVWRGGVTHCPHCDHHMEMHEWMSKANAREVITGQGIPYSKPGALFIISECPKCFELSWTHIDLNGSNFNRRTWDKKDTTLFEAEYDARMQVAEKEFDESPCKKCAKFKEVNYTYMYPLVTCTWRNGDRGHARKKGDCAAFSSRRTRRK